MQLTVKQARAVFLVIASILFILSYTLYVQVKDLIGSHEQVNQATVVKLKLEETISCLKDAETAQRGFLLTNDSLFLQPYGGAHERSRRLIRDLRSLTSDNAAQHAHLNSLSTFVELKFRTFRNAIDQYNVPGINDETKKNHLLKGKTTMDSIRYHVAAIAGIEGVQMREREKTKARHDALAPFYAFLLIIALLAVLTFFYDRTIKQLARSKKLLHKLRLLNGKLKQKNHALELYNKELDSFTYIASHDLKEPLRKIRMYSLMLEETEFASFSESSKAHYHKIQHSVKRMQQLLDDLLRYSHTTKTSLDLQHVDLNTIVKGVEENLAADLVETSAEVQMGSLPVIHGLPFQLKQLFENLMMNSLKYRQEHVAPRIHIDSVVISKQDIKHRFHKRSNLYHKIIFSDNGLGFEQSYAEKVFQLFQRVHTNGKQLGTGIGLTICKKIVQNHHGFIKATSQINMGTVFEIYFPYDSGKGIGSKNVLQAHKLTS